MYDRKEHEVITDLRNRYNLPTPQILDSDYVSHAGDSLRFRMFGTDAPILEEEEYKISADIHDENVIFARGDIKMLTISDTKIHVPISDRFSEIPNLKKLCILNSTITQTIDLRGCVHLRYLMLQGTTFRAKVLLPPNIEYLSLARSKDAEQFIDLSQCPKLRALWMSNAGYTSFPKAILEMEDLTTLRISQNRIDFHLNDTTRLKYLTSLRT